MKIDGVVLSAVTGGEDLISFPFRDTQRKAPYIVQQITGLDALDISANFSGFSGSSVPYFDMVLGKRDIVMRLALNPTFRNAKTMSGLRDELYKIIAADRTGKIFVNFCLGDDKLARVEGRITKVETNHFALKSEAQITISCENGILRAPSVNNLDISTLGREFFITDCISSAWHGFQFEVKFLEDSPQFLMTGPDTTFSVRRVHPDGSFGFRANDTLKVNTEADARSVRLAALGLEVSIIENVEGFRGSQWPLIFPGRNRFQIVTNAELTKLSYKEAWWGI